MINLDPDQDPDPSALAGLGRVLLLGVLGVLLFTAGVLALGWLVWW